MLRKVTGLPAGGLPLVTVQKCVFHQNLRKLYRPARLPVGTACEENRQCRAVWTCRSGTEAFLHVSPRGLAMGRLLAFLRLVCIVGLVGSCLAWSAFPCSAQQNNNNNNKDKSRTIRIYPSTGASYLNQWAPYFRPSPYIYNPSPPLVFNPPSPFVYNPANPFAYSPVNPFVYNPANPWLANQINNPFPISPWAVTPFNNPWTNPWAFNQMNPLASWYPWNPQVTNPFGPATPVTMVQWNQRVNFPFNRVTTVTVSQWNPLGNPFAFNNPLAFNNPFMMNQLNALQAAQFNAALNPFAVNGFQGGDGAFGGGFNAGGFRGF
jgi:hypothetical protein